MSVDLSRGNEVLAERGVSQPTEPPDIDPRARTAAVSVESAVKNEAAHAVIDVDSPIVAPTAALAPADGAPGRGAGEHAHARLARTSSASWVPIDISKPRPKGLGGALVSPIASPSLSHFRASKTSYVNTYAVPLASGVSIGGGHEVSAVWRETGAGAHGAGVEDPHRKDGLCRTLRRVSIVLGGSEPAGSLACALPLSVVLLQALPATPGLAQQACGRVWARGGDAPDPQDFEWSIFVGSSCEWGPGCFLALPRGGGGAVLVTQAPEASSEPTGEYLERYVTAAFLFGFDPAQEEAAYWGPRKWAVEGLEYAAASRSLTPYGRYDSRAEMARIVRSVPDAGVVDMVALCMGGSKSAWREAHEIGYAAVCASLCELLLSKASPAALRAWSPFFGGAGGPLGHVERGTSLGPLLARGRRSLTVEGLALLWKAAFVEDRSLSWAAGLLFRKVAASRPHFLALLLSCFMVNGSRTAMTLMIRSLGEYAARPTSSALTALVAVLVASSALHVLGRLLNIWANTKILRLAVTRTAEDAMRHLFAVPASHLASADPSSLLQVFSDDAQKLEAGLGTAMSLINQSMSFCMSIGLALYINPLIAASIALVEGLLILAQFPIARRAKGYGKLRQQRREGVLASADECIAGQATLRTFGAERWAYARFAASQEAFGEANEKSRAYGSLLSDIIAAGNAVIQAAILAIGAALIPSGSLSVGVVLSIMTIVGGFDAALSKLSSGAADVLAIIPSLARIEALLVVPVDWDQPRLDRPPADGEEGDGNEADEAGEKGGAGEKGEAEDPKRSRGAEGPPAEEVYVLTPSAGGPEGSGKPEVDIQVLRVAAAGGPRPAPGPAPAPAALPGVAPPALQLRDVSFSYTGRLDAASLSLRGASLSLPRGALVALVGPSGAGKSSLAAAASLRYPLTRGELLLGGASPPAVGPARWRRRVRWVTPEAHVVRGTALENVRLARPGASEAEVEAAARAARLHDTLESLPQGYKTPLLPRTLSASQRARLSVARALLARPAVLFFDDLSSVLDAAAERALLESLRAEVRRGGPRAIGLVVAVTARYGLCEAADLVVVAKGGAVAECGRHEELLRKPGGVYRGLVSLSDAMRAGAGEAEAGRVTVGQLAALPILAPAAANAAALEALVPLVEREEHEKGARVASQGAKAARVLLVLAGSLARVRRAGDAERPVGRLSAGDAFGGEAAVATSPPLYKESLEALAPCVLGSVPAEALRDWAAARCPAVLSALRSERARGRWAASIATTSKLKRLAAMFGAKG